MAETQLHPILAQKGITPGTPEAVLAVAEVFVKMKYEDNPKNKDNIFGKWFGVNHTAWCAEFVSYCFNKGGAGYVVNKLQTNNGYLSCGAGIKAMKKRGLVQVPVEKAQPGDIIFFDWEHDHDPDHTGIVLKNNPKKKTVTCREGNTSRGDGSRSNGGQVAQRDRNYSVVFAVFRPNWKPVTKATAPAVAKQPIVVPVVTTTPAPTTTAPVVTAPVAIPAPAAVAPVKLVKPKFVANLKKGSKGANVKFIQARLKVSQTGVFDQATHNAVILFQKRVKLTADGIVGPITWSKF